MKEEDGQVTLSRRQVACLVAHMFFCTIQPCTHMKQQVTYFHVLRVVRENLKLKLLCIIAAFYFAQNVMDC